MSAKYDRLKAVAKEHYGERAMCTVIAVAITADVSFGKAQAAMARAGRKKGCGAPMSVMFKALHELGYAGKVAPHTGKTMRTILADADPSKRYIVEVAGHVAAITEGAIQDWSKGRMKRIINLFEIGMVPTA